MNTTENNKLIAEFLDNEYKNGDYFKLNISTENCNIFHIGDLKFNSDWNWLMLVIEKIFNTDEYYKGFIDYNSSIVSDGQIRISYKISDVYLQCIEFIKWYNNKN